MPTTNTPNMNLNLPVPGQEPGPDYATDNNAAFTQVDQHNHTPGYGVAIPSAGIGIDAGLAFNNTDAYTLRSSRYINNSSTLSGTDDLGCVYVSGGNLYYNNSAGTAVQITNGSSVNAGAGSISGLPSGTASVTFTGSTYVFQSATSIPATVDVGSVIIRNTIASSFGVTISPINALPSSYNLTLPTIPAGTRILTLDNSGNIGSTWNVDGTTIIAPSGVIQIGTLPASSVNTSQIVNGAVSADKLSCLNIASSTTTGNG